MQYASTNESSFHSVDSVEGFWNTGRDEEPNLGYKIRPKSGYYPVPPHDTLMDLRSQMVLTMAELGIPVEIHHHEVGTAGQCEIDMRFDTLVKMGDNTQTYKYVVRNEARAAGKVATFMPKPIFADNGSGMHVHQSVWLDGKNQMFGSPDDYAGLSEFARYYIGGLLKHGPSLLAFAAPTVNSYRRLVPGFEAPVNLVYSQAQPVGRDSHSDLLEERAQQAHRVPLPGHRGQPVSRLLGAADGRSRWRQEQDRSGRAGRLRPLRGERRAASPHQEHAGLPARGARLRSAPTMTSCSKAASSRQS